MWSHLLIIYPSACVNDVLITMSFPVPMSSKLFPIFSSTCLNISGFMLKSLIQLYLSFVKSLVYLYSKHKHPVWVAPFLEDGAFFQCISVLFTKIQLFTCVWIYLWILSSIQLIKVWFITRWNAVISDCVLKTISSNCFSKKFYNLEGSIVW